MFRLYFYDTVIFFFCGCMFVFFIFLFFAVGSNSLMHRSVTWQQNTVYHTAAN